MNGQVLQSNDQQDVQPVYLTIKNSIENILLIISLKNVLPMKHGENVSNWNTFQLMHP